MTSHSWKKKCLNYWWIKLIINLGRLVWSTLTQNKCQEDEVAATWKRSNRKGKWNVASVKAKNMPDTCVHRGNLTTAEVSFRMRIKEVLHRNWWNSKLIKTLLLKVQTYKICALADSITLQAGSSYFTWEKQLRHLAWQQFERCWVLSEKILHEEGERKMLYKAKESHWIYWKDNGSNTADGVTVHKKKCYSKSWKCTKVCLVVNCLVAVCPDINSRINKGRWPVQEWPIQPLLSEKIFCEEKMRNGQKQWITSFSEQTI